ncbi:hypothetical protein BDN72DRAFT_823457 [Pluteus cervinus]|uniref:Uncharacterized protein n=1 Tax=Pluteus cervinus TaxID=181527 RepID=A0ACD3ANA5_9AGAR|nr:hypothetical protein BDN72DRAFT_823457 [Pluteus cervinus]
MHSSLSPMSFSTSRSTMTMKNSIVTHPSLHIRDAHDAHVILEAVRLGMVPLIKRRLLASEREELRSGHVYVWEEAQDEGGLLRWTDGRRWSQSRMRGDYLFYEEKVETTQEEKDAKAARRARRASDPTAVMPPTTRRKDRPSKPNGLTKQTYSVAVHLPGTNESRKWHVVAYFRGNDYVHLPVIESYEYLRNIRVTPGIFLSSKVLSSRVDRFSYYSDESELYDDRGHSPMSPIYRHQAATPGSPHSSASSSSSSLQLAHLPSPRPPMPLSLNLDKQRILLPPIDTLNNLTSVTYHRRGSLASPSSPYPPPSYTPLSSEDRRVLNSFRIVL